MTSREAAGVNSALAGFVRSPGRVGVPGMLDAVPVAFWARVSTRDQQDPTLSIPRQLERAQVKLPAGWYIARFYWDVESGGIALEDRGHSRTHEAFNVNVPRDGGLQEMLADARSKNPPFAAVICEDIERVARDTYYSTKLEKELKNAGIPLFAADEPIDLDGAKATTVLVRRVKQAVAEWQRLATREKSWDGFIEHNRQGFNIGKVPYGYLADRIPHPVPAKRAEGVHKTRLAPDPVRGPVVAAMFAWRVDERLSYAAITDRLNADPDAYPPPTNTEKARKAGLWTIKTVQRVLSNPKYTGFMVWNRRASNQGGTANDPAAWVWSPEITHQPIISRALYDAAQTISGTRKGSRCGDGPNSHPRTERTYAYRSLLRCGDCGRRLFGHANKHHIYYTCKADTHDPRFIARHPNHPRTVNLREDVLDDAVADFFAQRIFGPQRAALLADQFDTTTRRAHMRHQTRHNSLTKQLDDIDRKRARLLRELEDTDVNDSEAREIRDRRRTLANQTTSLRAELDQLDAQRPDTPDDPNLINLLPALAPNLHNAPNPLRRRLYDAFDLTVIYHRTTHEAVIRATVTHRAITTSHDATTSDTAGPDQPATTTHARTPPGGKDNYPVDREAGERF